MAVKFKVIERGMPGAAAGGPTKFYASPVSEGEMTLAGLTKAIEKVSTVSGADIRAVLYALVDVSIDSLSNGTVVRLGDLGSLRMSLSSEGRETAKDVTASAIKKSSVIFTPGIRIKEMLKGVTYQKA